MYPMWVCVYILYIYIYIYLGLSMYVCVCICVCVCVYMYVCPMYVCMYVCMYRYVFMYLWMDGWMDGCIHTYVCIRMYAQCMHKHRVTVCSPTYIRTVARSRERSTRYYQLSANPVRSTIILIGSQSYCSTWCYSRTPGCIHIDPHSLMLGL